MPAAMHPKYPALTRRHVLFGTTALAAPRLCPALASGATEFDPQPYFAAINRALSALAELGSPIPEAYEIAALSKSKSSTAVESTERLLAGRTLIRLEVRSDGSMRPTSGGAERQLVEQGWRVFLVRVSNPSGRADGIYVSNSGLNAASLMRSMMSAGGLAQRPPLLDTLNKAPFLEQAWLTSQMRTSEPLSGFVVEYRLIELYSRDAGHREGYFAFGPSAEWSVLTSAPRAAYRREGLQLDFQCLPTRDVTLSVLDSDDQKCVASLTIRDVAQRIYPPQVMRLAPDMTYQPQIYRADGETVRLPDGEYSVLSKRGPEYLATEQAVDIDNNVRRIEVKLQRWIDPAKWGWYSGDTHLHAAGCYHYQTPTEGVNPETMIRHVRGEGLSIGEVLTWAGGRYYQHQFFTGRAESPAAVMEHPDLQAAMHASLQPRPTPEDPFSQLRYDVEVSGYPSSMSGHLVLLRLKAQDYPGTEGQGVEVWPTWNLPILQWARDQGAVIGYAHCSAGMMTDSRDLPNYEIPPFDSIGINEGIVDVTHGLCDFMSGCNGFPIAELNAWYHMLNCGFRLVMIGETDYPCFVPSMDARPGLGRSYVRMDQRPIDDAGYDAWISNLKRGRLYYGDGRSHFLEFTVNGHASGEEDVALRPAAKVTVSALIAARLDPTPTADTRRNAAEEPWHLEHARYGDGREVPVELVMNGAPVERRMITADGVPRRVTFKIRIERSSWVSLRILPSGHTYPVFARANGKPIRASRRSAQWCRKCVDKLWEVKSPHIRDSEREAAAAAYEYARAIYDRIINEAEVA
jgi:hypothetical protein